MTQPDNPVPARSARPQLFGESKATPKSSGKSRQPDFGPSILATIDGTPRRESRSRDAAPIKRVLWMSVFALAAVAVYFGVKLGMMPSASTTQLVAVQPKPVVPPVVPTPAVERVAEPAAPAASAAPTAVGVASIENVAPASAPAAPAADVAASLNNIQQALAESETKAAPVQAAPKAEQRKAEKPAAPKTATAPKPDRAVAAPSKTATAKSADGDTDLLAAMLPHIKRRGGGAGPTSPDFEKRCGQLTGDAVTECRVRFCTGREGVDAACPSAAAR